MALTFANEDGGVRREIRRLVQMHRYCTHKANAHGYAAVAQGVVGLSDRVQDAGKGVALVQARYRFGVEGEQVDLGCAGRRVGVVGGGAHQLLVEVADTVSVGVFKVIDVADCEWQRRVNFATHDQLVAQCKALADVFHQVEFDRVPESRIEMVIVCKRYDYGESLKRVGGHSLIRKVALANEACLSEPVDGVYPQPQRAIQGGSVVLEAEAHCDAVRTAAVDHARAGEGGTVLGTHRGGEQRGEGACERNRFG